MLGRTGRTPARAKRRVLMWLVSILLVWVSTAQALDVPSPAAEDFLLFRLINELRAYPAMTLERMGIDVDQARRALGPDAWVLDVSLPPLAWKTELYEAAEAHRQDMLARGFYSHTGSDGSDVELRVQRTGYESALTTEQLGFLSVLTFVDEREAASAFFEQWLRDELDPSKTQGLTLLNPLLTQMAVTLQPSTVQLSGGPPVNAYLAVAVLARPFVKELAAVGNLRPPGSDLWMDPDQVVSGYQVVCRAADGHVLWAGPTDPLGGYQCPMPDQTVGVEVVDPATGEVIWRIPLAGTDENLWADLFF